MFQTNVGGVDRVLRIAVGAGLLLWFFLEPGAGLWHYAKLIGIIPLVTGILSTCPAYSLFGFSTCLMKA